MIPATLGNTPVEKVMPVHNLAVIRQLRHFVVEEEKSARRFLHYCGYEKPESVQMYLLNEHSDRREIPDIFVRSGNENLGMISEAGAPGVADPGASLAAAAHGRGMAVVPLTGPSSILLALMASGLNGQNFAFTGYLPVKAPDRAQRIRFLEKRSMAENQSQIFMEAPYRNDQLVHALFENCKPETRLCIAANLTLEDEWIRTMTIRTWKNAPPPGLKKKPAIFILQA
jgi:16S rRNA (cytidine1402-2'-O)-methyltransferase